MTHSSLLITKPLFICLTLAGQAWNSEVSR